MKKCFAIILIIPLILLCGCQQDDKSDFVLSSYYEDVYLDGNQNNTNNSYYYSSSNNKTSTNKSSKTSKTSKASNTKSKVDTTISFVKTAEFANIGKSLLDISKTNPKMILNPAKKAIDNGVAQLMGEEKGEFAYYFYSANGMPLLSDLFNDAYSPYVNCVGIYTTVGRLFKNTSAETTPKKFFKDLWVKEYTYTSNSPLEPGLIKFSYQNYNVVISYIEEIDVNLLYNTSNEIDLPPQYIKNTYEIFIIDKTVNKGLGYDKWIRENNQ